MKTRIVPGHAKEFETSLALALFPGNVRRDAMDEQADKDPLEATVEKGRIFATEAVAQVAHFVKEMMDGKIRPPELKYYP